jgi:hypothetical protein
MLHELRQTHVKTGFAWRIGGERDLQWIRGPTGVARQITAAIPPVFADHATLFRASRNCCFRQTMRKWHTMPLGCVVLVHLARLEAPSLAPAFTRKQQRSSAGVRGAKRDG